MLTEAVCNTQTRAADEASKPSKAKGSGAK
jgi:hypothetical protein